MTQAELETPRDPADIYDAQTPEDAAELLNRPLFTGVILRAAQGRSALCLVQHPCAMRKGTSLLPNLLVCSVVDSGVHRNQWRNHTPTEMPLPGLPEFGEARLDTKRPGGTTLRHQLTNPQIRSTVRKDLRKLLAEASSP